MILDCSVTGVMYLNIQRENLLPWACYSQIIYHLGNAPDHCARIVHDFMEQEDVTVLHQPPLSPDCNFVYGTCYSMLWTPEISNHKIRRNWVRPYEKEWHQLGHDTLQNLVDSMPRHMAAIMQACRGHIKRVLKGY